MIFTCFSLAIAPASCSAVRWARLLRGTLRAECCCPALRSEYQSWQQKTIYTYMVTPPGSTPSLSTLLLCFHVPVCKSYTPKTPYIPIKSHSCSLYEQTTNTNGQTITNKLFYFEHPHLHGVSGVWRGNFYASRRNMYLLNFVRILHFRHNIVYNCGSPNPLRHPEL